MTLSELKAFLEASAAPNRELDVQLACHARWPYHDWPSFQRHQAKTDYDTAFTAHQPWMKDWTPCFTASFERMMELVDWAYPGAFWLAGRGRLKASEPLYGAQLLFGSEEVFGSGEHDATAQLAVALALVDAWDRASLAADAGRALAEAVCS